MHNRQWTQTIQLQQIQTGTDWQSIKDFNSPRGTRVFIFRELFKEFQAVGA